MFPPNRSVLAILLAATAALGFSGCSDTPANDGSAAALASGAAGEAAAGGPPAASTPGGAPAEGLALEIVDEKRFQEILAAKRGQVVLVDFWATWCIECLELIPHTVRLHDALRDRGLAVLLVSFDSPDDRQTVEEVLAGQQVDFESYISQYGADVKSAEAFQIERATLPHLKLYDRQGVLRKVFSTGRVPPEPFGADDIEKAVAGLLAE
ncbi:MAG: TlpA disulfide reductase family protein [Pirellulales bacterium]|jgi:thiol-disulfide isomerase/thioredoxin|nr:TlpA disulfide reductase family protein [Thermoguttaceae bacterium]MDD4787486.1 TlpA disulfide reductase family protein [Pirellulales bacterium]NLZ00669.1 TlpA family protein disulfide reductase [Pirellulaceae bacterium]